MPSENDEQRKLAAIMFTDMVGYSALSQRNDKLAQDLLEEHREILRAIFPRFHGAEIKTIGDAFLVEFNSALEAAQCAIEIQRALAHRNTDVPMERWIELKIGIHIGDVVHRGGDVYGDGVNIASRIEPLAGAGGICVSMDVERQIRNAVETRFEKLAPTELKNISVPMDLFRIVLPWERSHAAKSKTPISKSETIGRANKKWIWAATVIVALAVLVIALFRSRLQTGVSTTQDVSAPRPGLAEARPSIPEKSIAVLPLENLSGDSANQYFAEGIQEEILTRLSKIADLKVISRTSTQKYKNAPSDLREIAKQLGVANILEGSVQKASDQVRISVQLINAVNDSHLWAETYDRKLIDVFQLETDLAQKIATSLEAKLTGREQNEISAHGTSNAEAYDAYLHAVVLSSRQSVAGNEETIKFTRRAVELDPNYAQAWCLLAVCESQKYFYPEHSEAQLARARVAAETAMRLAPDSSEGPAALGTFNYYCLQNYDAAITQLQLAHERAPNDANVLLGIGLVKRRQGKIEESIAVQREAALLDPLNVDVWVNIGRGLRGLRRFEEARSMFDRARTMAPDDSEILAQRAEIYAAQGDVTSAWKIMEPLNFAPTERGFGAKVQLLALQRRMDDAEQMISSLLTRKDIPPLFVTIGRMTLAQIYLAKGETASAQPLLIQAEGELNQLRAAGDNGVLLRDVLLSVEALLGHRDQVETIAKSLLESTRSDAWQFPREEETVARAYVALRDFDRALPLIEHALRVPAVESLTTAYLRLDPAWDPIRNDPRFQKLCEQPHK